MPCFMWTSACVAVAAMLLSASRAVAAIVPVGPERLINEQAEGFQTQADVALDATGGFVVVWNDRGMRVAGRRFDVAGMPRGPEFTVDASESYKSRSSSVAFQPDGTLLTASE